MLGVLKRLFGGEQEAPISADPFGREAKAQAASAPPPLSSPEPPPEAFLLREEILDAKTRIAGYRFRVQGSASDDEAMALLGQGRVKEFAERRLAVIELDRGQEFIPALKSLVAPGTHFLITAPTVDGVEAIRAAEAKLALRGQDLPSLPEALGEAIALLVLDFTAYTLTGFEGALASFRDRLPKAAILVENVGRWPERRYCHAQGAHYCCGPFATAPDEESGGDLGESRVVLIELLNLVRKDAELAEIVAVAKRDPAVTLKLIALANSPLLGIRGTISSLEQAIFLLGREQLYRWLAIGLFRAGGSPRDEVLLAIALTRGLFLERLGERLGLAKAQCDELFLVGLLSLIDSLLGEPLPQILARLRLPEAVRTVLIDNGGPWGRHLLLALALEKGRSESAQALASKLSLTLAAASATMEEARALSDEALASLH